MNTAKTIITASIFFAASLSSVADVVTNNLTNAEGTKIGYEITGIGNFGIEKANVFTCVTETMTWTIPSGVTSFEYLVVAGGGGGGNGTNAGNQQAGGGGAGGYLSGNATDIASGSLVKILVGPGGAAKTSGTASSLLFGETEIKAIGGGRGGSAAKGGAGGSGGGGAHTTSKKGGLGTEGQGYAGGNPDSNGNSGGGGGAGGPGYTPNKSENQGGDGGPGLQNDITGTAVWYAAGGGGSSRQNGSAISGAGGLGGGGEGGASPKNNGGDATSWGSGGGGACGSGKVGGAGYQGVVVLRHTLTSGSLKTPVIESKAYNGQNQVAELDCLGVCEITTNAGGTNVGEYDVELTKLSGYTWADSASDDAITVKFAITPGVNQWTTNASITKVVWTKGAEDAGIITNATTLFDAPAVSITKDGNSTEYGISNLSDLSAWDPGVYCVTYTAPTSDNYTGPETQTQTIEFTIYDANDVPPYSVELGNMTVNTERVLGIPYELKCDVVSEKKASLFVSLYESEDAVLPLEGFGDINVTNDVPIVGGNGILKIANLCPDKTYYAEVYAKVGDESSDPTARVAVIVPGPATDLAATVRYTYNPKEFIISGSVTPGLGTTVVTLWWAINSDAPTNQQKFEFSVGDSGEFSTNITYTAITDTLTWKVTVTNAVTTESYNEQGWSSEMEQSTFVREEESYVAYTWTGNGGDNLWTNANNWAANKDSCYGYPGLVGSSGYYTSSAIFTDNVTVNLNGFTAQMWGSNKIDDLCRGLVFEMPENVDTMNVVISNGTIKIDNDNNCCRLGTAGVTLTFKDAVFDIETFKFSNDTDTFKLVFEGNSEQPWQYRPKNTDEDNKTYMMVCNGTMQSEFYASTLECPLNHTVVVSNAVWKVDGTIGNSDKPKSLATDMYFADTATQSRLECTGKMSLRHTNFYIDVPEDGFEQATIAAVELYDAGTTYNTSKFILDVTDYRSGKLLPLAKFTEAASDLDITALSVEAYDDGTDVTAKRNGELVWVGTDADGTVVNTLYYKQDSQMGFSITIR